MFLFCVRRSCGMVKHHAIDLQKEEVPFYENSGVISSVVKWRIFTVTVVNF